MRETIQKQLNKITTDYTVDEENNTIHFSKKEKTAFEVWGVYQIEVDEDTLTNTESILYVNYNGCSLPPEKELKIEVEKFSTPYMKVNALTKNNKVWSGYLPINKTKIIKEVK